MPNHGYTPAQILQFYDRINLPQAHRHNPETVSSTIANSIHTGLPFLSILQRYCLASIPFENLDLHYSTHHSVSIGADDVFDKIVTRGQGRGGYCMENNTLFANVLRGLGFAVVSTGARISSSVGAGCVPLSDVTFTGWSHMVNLITFPNSTDKYFVDIGFGSGGATRPMLLSHDEKGVLNIAPSQWGRVIHAPIPGLTSEQKFWVYEKRNHEDEPFSPCYCFGETEFSAEDFGVMNYSTSTARTSWFTYQVVCVKMILDDKGEKVVGNVQVFEKDIKKRVDGKTEVPMEIKSEGDRTLALEKYLEIPLTEKEKSGIKGMASAL